MWKKRETHLVDIYKNNQAKDDFMLPLTTVTATDAETFNNNDNNNNNNNNSNSIYSSVSMSKSHSSLLFSSGNSSNTIDGRIRKKNYSSTSVYQGNEFDVFGKEQLEEHFAPLYSIEQFTPTKLCRKERYIKGEILLRTEQEFKRGQVEAMLQNTTIIKKRKTSIEQQDAAVENADITTVIDGVFIKSTAAPNTPIANIFLEDNNHNEDDDLEYY